MSDKNIPRDDMTRGDKIFWDNQGLCDGNNDPVSVTQAKYLMKKSAKEAWDFTMGYLLQDFEEWWNEIIEGNTKKANN